MNIFVLDLNPVKAAKYHTDKHVCKMIIETAQLLCTALPYLEPDRKGMYKSTHTNHPCSKWVRASTGNYEWLRQLGVELSKEYTNRYKKIHKCHSYLVHDLKLSNGISIDIMTPFAQAMPDKYKNLDVVQAYQNYYMGEKQHIAKWKTRKPRWFQYEK